MRNSGFCTTTGGTGQKEKDIDRRSEDVLFCRGDLTRTDDPLHPMQVR